MGISFFNNLFGGLRFISAAENNGVVSGREAIPIFGPVHGVEPSGKGGNFSDAFLSYYFLKIGQMSQRAFGERIPPVGEKMEINFFKAAVFGKFKKGI